MNGSFNATFITFTQATSQPLWAPKAAAIARRMAMLELELAMAQFPSWLKISGTAPIECSNNEQHAINGDASRDSAIFMNATVVVLGLLL